MSLTSRALIDSIATTGLKTIISPYQNEIASSSSIKVAMLEFGSSCLTTPWPNGASSSILEQLQLAASSCKADASTVSSTASATLRLCDTVSTPRVPALHVVTKKVDLSSSKAPVSSDMLLEGLQNAQEQISQNRAESKRDAFEEQENRNKRMKICESNQEKAEKKTALKTEGTSKDDCNGHPKPEEGKLNRESSSKDDNSDKQAAVQESPQVSGEQQLEVEDKSSSAANAQESAGGDASEDDDFLPGIVEDDGPDEDDV